MDCRHSNAAGNNNNPTTPVRQNYPPFVFPGPPIATYSNPANGQNRPPPFQFLSYKEDRNNTNNYHQPPVFHQQAPFSPPMEPFNHHSSNNKIIMPTNPEIPPLTATELRAQITGKPSNPLPPSPGKLTPILKQTT
ncbi:hypothetical protein MBLNU230_g4958t1 [Neophaeotheca triangularis]